MMKGLIIFYYNFPPGVSEEDQKTAINFLKDLNKTVFERVTADTGYEVAVFPTTNEACRIEKVDMDKPFPRFSPNNLDLATMDRPKKKRADDEEDDQ